MKLYCVRHGETKENVTKICQGHRFGTLNETGIEQAKKIGDRLKTTGFDLAYVSDLSRTMDTAKWITQHHPGLSVIWEKRLREKSGGVFEGRPHDEMFREREEIGVSPFAYTPEGGESFYQVRNRVVHFLTELVMKHERAKQVLIVSHGGALTCLYLYLAEKGFDAYRDYHPDNTALTLIEIEKGASCRFLLKNCTSHLSS